MKSVLIACFILFSSVVSQAQERKSLSAERPVSKSEMMNDTYPKITLNDNKCRFKQVAVRANQNEQYELEISFHRDCDGQSSVTFNFDEIEEAILVKNLMLSENDYELFNLTTSRGEQPGFEIIYHSQKQ